MTEGVGFIDGWLLGCIGIGGDIQTLPNTSAGECQRRLLFALIHEWLRGTINEGGRHELRVLVEGV